MYHFEVRSLFVTDILLSYVWLFALFAFCTLLLASCKGGTNSGASLFVDQIKVKVELEIKENIETIFASVSIAVEVCGFKSRSKE